MQHINIFRRLYLQVIYLIPCHKTDAKRVVLVLEAIVKYIMENEDKLANFPRPSMIRGRTAGKFVAHALAAWRVVHEIYIASN